MSKSITYGEPVEIGKINIKFGKTLKSLRKQNKRTQKEVAQFLGLSTTSYSRYEQDLRQPDFETLAKLAVLFNVDFGQFFFDGIYYLGKSYKEEFESRLSEKYIDEYDVLQELESALSTKHRTERRAAKLIFKVHSLLRGSKTIPGELQYFEEQLKTTFGNLHEAQKFTEMFGGFKNFDDEIIKLLNQIAEYNKSE